jgi:PAS domain S-box-containing protein
MDQQAEELRILILEDVPSDAALEVDELRDAGLIFFMLRVDTREAFVKALDEFNPDIVLADYKLPAYDGREALEYACRVHPQIPVIIVTGALGDEAAVELLKLGARDYVLKGSLARLAPAIKRALSEERDIRNRKLVEHELHDSELRYRRLFEAARDGILILDAETGMIADANPFILELLSYSRSQCIGKMLWEIGLFADTEDSKKAFRELQATGHIRYEDLPLETKDGRRRDVEFVSNVYEVAGKKVIQCNIRDITERLRAEEALRDSEARYKRITEGLTDYQYTVRIENGRAVETIQSPACVTVTGYKSEEFAANPDLWIQMVVPEDRERVIARVRKVLAGMDVPPMEHRIIRKDGELRWVRCTIILFRDASGKLLSYDGVIRDITERKRVEQDIQDEKAFSDSLIHSLPDIFYLIDQQGSLLRWSRKGAELLGLSEEEMTGANVLAFIHEEDRPLISRKIKEAFETGSAETEARMLMKNGIRHYLLTATRIETQYGVNVIGVGVDITERKLAGDALKESEERYRYLFDNMLEGYAHCRMLFENDTPTDLVYLSVNKAFERITPLQNVVGKKITELIPGIRETNPELFEVYGRVSLSGRTEKFETYVAAWGMWLSVTAYSSSKGYFVAVFDDITERKRAEGALLRANRALKTLSAGNLALVRAASEDELLRTVTGIIVEQGGYSMAAVCYANDDPDQGLTPVAWSGIEDSYCSGQRLSWVNTEQGQLPISRAIRSGTPQICHDIASDPDFEPWRDDMLARGYKANIALPLIGGGRTFGGLNIYSSAADAFDEEEVRLLGELANDLAYGVITLRTRAAHEKQAVILRESLEQSIQTIASTVEARDPYTAGHQRRVGELATAIALEMGLPEEQVKGIHLAAIIHDLGKINIPSEILSKPGKLTNIEYMLIKTHPQAGCDILKHVEFPWPIADIILQHHERMDGSGYPQGLKDGQILLESRIMAVADVVEAMSSHRPYRPALGVMAALSEIDHGRGGAYDTAVVDACLRLFVEKGFTFSS